MSTTKRPPLSPTESTGSPRKFTGRSVPAARRFWARVLVDDGCWLWVGRRTGLGYGHFDIGGRAVMAHRFAYELLRGAIPDGMELDHVKKRGCASRACVKPAHLEPVSHLVNCRRGSSVRPTHCRNGHPRDAANTSRTRAGRRVCLACQRVSNRAYSARRKEARGGREAA